MATHTCNLLSGSCAAAHTHFGMCYYALTVKQQAMLVRASSAATAWANAPTGNVPSTMQYGAQQMRTAMQTYLYYAGTARTQPMPAVCQVTANMRKVR